MPSQCAKLDLGLEYRTLDLGLACLPCSWGDRDDAKLDRGLVALYLPSWLLLLMQTLLHLLPGGAAAAAAGLLRGTPSKAQPVLYLWPCASREYRRCLSEAPV